MELRAILFLLVILPCSWVHAQTRMVRVGLLRDRHVQEVMLTALRGPMTLTVDGERIAELDGKDALKVKLTEGHIALRSLSRSYTVKRTAVIRAAGGGSIRMRILDPQMPEREYTGSMDMHTEGGALLLTNEVPLEEYVAGTVQSEAGKDKDIEYYKLQAVSCRTYALANQRKHIAEGYELCDGTHCQVYKGRNLQDTIRQAVEATRDMVAVDASIHLIHATFHSNCGGETMNAEDLWSKSEPYLVGTVDTFCINAPHAEWRKTMSRTAWLGYLHRTYNVDTSNVQVANAVCDFDPGCRFLYIANVEPEVPLEQVRADLKLNSAYFRIWPNGDQVVFDGRGFGHGVGLCQEGAMRMARKGYSFIDILHHYFAEVHLVDLHTIDFFRDDGN